MLSKTIIGAGRIGVTILLFFCVSGLGQNKCTTKLADVPEVRSLKLGMTYEQVHTQLPFLKTAKDCRASLTSAIDGSVCLHEPVEGMEGELEETEFYPNQHLGPSTQTDAKLKGVQKLGLQFFHRVLYSIALEYKDWLWKSGDDYISALSEKLQLPRGAWNRAYFTSTPRVPRSEEWNNQWVMDCQGFSVSADYGGRNLDSPMETYGPRIGFRNPEASAQASARREVVQKLLEEKRRREFKP